MGDQNKGAIGQFEQDKTLYKKIKIFFERKIDSKGFAITHRWLERYVQYASNIENIQYNPSKQTSELLNVGPIDNKELFELSGSQIINFKVKDQQLSEKVRIVHPQIWKFLLKRYGGGPELPIYFYKEQQNGVEPGQNSRCTPDFNPIMVDLQQMDGEMHSMVISAKSSVFTLIEEIHAKCGITFQVKDNFEVFSTEKMKISCEVNQIIVDLCTQYNVLQQKMITLAEIGIQHGSIILIDNTVKQAQENAGEATIAASNLTLALCQDPDSLSKNNVKKKHEQVFNDFEKFHKFNEDEKSLQLLSLQEDGEPINQSRYFDYMQIIKEPEYTSSYCCFPMLPPISTVLNIDASKTKKYEELRFLKQEQFDYLKLKGMHKFNEQNKIALGTYKGLGELKRSVLKLKKKFGTSVKISNQQSASQSMSDYQTQIQPSLLGSNNDQIISKRRSEQQDLPTSKELQRQIEKEGATTVSPKRQCL